MRFQPAERNLQKGIAQTQSLAAVVPDRKVLLSSPSKARGTGIRGSGPYGLVMQSLPISESMEWMTPDPTTAQSSRGTLHLVEGHLSPHEWPTGVSEWQRETHMQPQDEGAELKEFLQQADSEARQGWSPADQL